jgi:hypothetical protein
MKHKLTISTLLLLALFLTLAPTIMATKWYVDGVKGKDINPCKAPSTAACKTIGHAISLASSGDTVIVAAATYTENLTIGISLNVLGAGARTTIIDGGGVSRVVTISNAAVHVTLSELTIRNGIAPSYGGGILPRSFGGGINNSGTLTLTNSTVSGNSAPIPCFYLFQRFLLCRGPASGGGIYNSGALIISNSTISGNQAGGSHCTGNCSASGGGIYNVGTMMLITNSTLTGNDANAACSTSVHCPVVGGAFSSSGTVTLNNSTVEGNSAYSCSAVCSGKGGAIAGLATLQNSIIANNSGTNCGGTIKSNGYNLSSDTTCNFSNSGDRNDIDPKLGPLQYNGGPTQTQALLPGSPAIDAGNPSGCTDGNGQLLKTDQRGYPRPDSDDKTTAKPRCDMGAYESD